MDRENLVMFLYLLMRDRLPVGEVCQVIKEIQTSNPKEMAIFTNMHLEALAGDYADRLIECNLRAKTE